MSAISLNLKPTDRQLRQFGLIAFVALPLLGWVFSGKPTPETWRTGHTTIIGALASVGTTLAVLALLKPRVLKWLFVGACVAAFPIGFVVGEIVVLLIFLLGFVPMALIFRLIKRDALDRNLDRSCESYWQPKQPARNASSYYRQS